MTDEKTISPIAKSIAKIQKGIQSGKYLIIITNNNNSEILINECILFSDGRKLTERNFDFLVLFGIDSSVHWSKRRAAKVLYNNMPEKSKAATITKAKEELFKIISPGESLCITSIEDNYKNPELIIIKSKGIPENARIKAIKSFNQDEIFKAVESLSIA